MLSLISGSEFDPDAVVEIPAATVVLRARWAILAVAAEHGHVDAMEVLLQLNTDCMPTLYYSELTALLNAAALFAARSVTRCDQGQAYEFAYAPLFLLLRTIPFHVDGCVKCVRA